MSDWTDSANWPPRALALGMLAFLVYPALELAGAATAPSAARIAPAAGAAAVVLAAYVWACWRQPVAGPPLWGLLAVIAALAAIVPLVWGPGWLGLLMYPAVATALLVPGLAGLVCSACVGGATAAIGLGIGADRDAVLSVSLVTVLAGLAACGVARLTRLTRELRSARAEVAQLAAAGERLRLARDLHDAVKQQLFVASLELGAGRASLGADALAAAGHLEQAEQAVGEARTGLARLIGGMRPAGPARAGGPDLAAALRVYLDDWQRQHEISARFSARGEAWCPPEAREAMLWAALEALTNVARHSRAASVEVSVESGDGAVRVRVADDGRGFTPESAAGGHGLSIMAERLESIGGQAAVTGTVGGGTTVTLTWPVQGARSGRL